MGTFRLWKRLIVYMAAWPRLLAAGAALMAAAMANAPEPGFDAARAQAVLAPLAGERGMELFALVALAGVASFALRRRSPLVARKAAAVTAFFALAPLCLAVVGLTGMGTWQAAAMMLGALLACAAGGSFIASRLLPDHPDLSHLSGRRNVLYRPHRPEGMRRP